MATSKIPAIYPFFLEEIAALIRHPDRAADAVRRAKPESG
jgi:hypothetical protein